MVIWLTQYVVRREKIRCVRRIVANSLVAVSGYWQTHWRGVVP